MADDGPSAKKARKSKVALITGITGQDGSYLAELLLKKSYEVHGIIRRSSSFNTGRIEDLYQDPHCDTRNLFLHYGDLTDSSNCFEIVNSVKPGGEGVDEVGYDAAKPERELVKIDPKYFRPTEVELLIGDPTKAKQKLGWTPKVKMEELCREMVEADIKLVEKGDLTS